MSLHYTGLAPSEMAAVLAPFTSSTAALDFETSGLEPCAPGAYIRSFALAGESGVIAVDLRNCSPEAQAVFWEWAAKHPGFLFHNAGFDTAWALKIAGVLLPIKTCTLLMFRYLSTEGWTGQDWSLKTAMTQVLLWDEPNTADLYAWLKANKMDKSQMSEAPWDLLAKYNAMDAEATWLLYDELSTTLERRGVPANIRANFQNFLDVDAMNTLALLREQQLEGMPVDMEGLAAYKAELVAGITKMRDEFYRHELLVYIFARLRGTMIAKLMENCPPQFTKDGATTKRYENFMKKAQAMAVGPDEDIFNMDSPKQLSWLFYEQLGYTPAKFTPGGDASADKTVLHLLGPVGKHLIKYRKLRDKLKFAEALSNVQIDGVYHPSIKQAQAVTGRHGGGK